MRQPAADRTSLVSSLIFHPSSAFSAFLPRISASGDVINLESRELSSRSLARSAGDRKSAAYIQGLGAECGLGKEGVITLKMLGTSTREGSVRFPITKLPRDRCGLHGA